MAEKQKYDGDDGRVIADMSGIERPSLFGARPFRAPGGSPPERARRDDGEEARQRPWETEEVLTPEERRMYMFGALKAALLIASAFIAGFGAIVLAMLYFWT